MRAEPSWMRLVPLWKKAQRTRLPLPPCEAAARRQSATRKKAFTRIQPCWHRDLDSQPPTLWEMFLLFVSHPVYGMLLKQPTWAKTTNLNFSVSKLRSFPELYWETHFSSFSPFKSILVCRLFNAVCFYHETAPMCFSFFIKSSMFLILRWHLSQLFNTNKNVFSFSHFSYYWCYLTRFFFHYTIKHPYIRLLKLFWRI